MVYSVGDMEGKRVCYEGGSGNEWTEPDNERNGLKEERREQTSREEKWDCESFLRYCCIVELVCSLFFVGLDCML
jgi:hypothetical protein